MSLRHPHPGQSCSAENDPPRCDEKHKEKRGKAVGGVSRERTGKQLTAERTVCRVAAEARAFSQQSTAAGLLPANPAGSPFSIIFILTPSAPRSRETQSTASLFLRVLLSQRVGGIFRRTRLPRCGCLGGIRIRSEFRKIHNLESLQSSVSILYIL